MGEGEREERQSWGKVASWRWGGIDALGAKGSRTLWVISIHFWRRTPWVVGVLGEGTEGLSGRRLAGQSRQQSASSGLVRRLLNRYRNHILVWSRIGRMDNTHRFIFIAFI